MPTDRPAILLAHWAGLSFFTERQLDRVAVIGDLLDREAIGSWDDPRAAEQLAAAEVILGHWGCPRIDGAVLDHAPRLRYVAYAAGTIRHTIAPEVFDRGIRVTTGAPANAEPVAEYALAVILLTGKDALWRRDLLRDPTVADARRPSEVPIGNWRRTVGIVGASMVGRRLIELLRSFPHLAVLVYDPYLDAAAAADLGVELVGDVTELCARADVLSIHAPDLPSTRHLVGARQLAALRTGATLVNTARGGLVDHDALVAELEAGRLYAVLDVTDPEPLPGGSPLRTLPNVFLTPHLAGSEGRELGRMADHVVDELRRWVAGEPARNEVTRGALDRIA